MEEIKNIIGTTITLLKELNVRVGKGEVDGDFLLKLSTTMNVAAKNLNKYVKQNKLNISGGVEKKNIIEEDDE